VAATPAGAYRLSWLLAAIDQERQALAEIRRLERELVGLLDEHGTTLRDEPGIGPIAAATLVVEVGDPFRFAGESKFARWCGTGAVALSSGEGSGAPVRHDSTTAATGASTASSTRPASPNSASTATPAPTSTARSVRARPDVRPAAPTNATSPTE
jgi:Transposase IS116/IS110/IS902 family